MSRVGESPSFLARPAVQENPQKTTFENILEDSM